MVIPGAQGSTQSVQPARTILVVEDERELATAIAQRIVSHGWTVRVASDGYNAVKAALQLKPDLIIMDIMLPVMDGIEATRRILAEHPIPIIMLTARDAETDKVRGLGAGADDYMTKPFSPRELIARCEALLRRVDKAALIAKNHEQEKMIEFPGLLIDQTQRMVTYRNQQIHLTPTEFDLLATMARKPQTVFTREELLEEIWNWHDASGTRTVDSHIKALRHKLDTQMIRTAHGIGYAFEPPVEEAEEKAILEEKDVAEEQVAAEGNEGHKVREEVEPDSSSF